MPKRRPALTVIIVTVMLALCLVIPAQAQDAATCPALVSQSLTALATNCANLNRDTSCLGHEDVLHTAFVGSVPADFYTQPGDRVDLLEVETIQTGALNLAQGLWGVNVMNVDANVPAEAGTKGVVFIQLGGVEVENAVDPEAIANGTTELTPMQSFYLRTGVGGVPCAEAPSLLFVQGPSGEAVDLTVFGLAVRLESTIVLRTLPSGDQLGNTLELIVLAGLVRLNAGTPDEVVIPPGYKTSLLLCSEFESLGIEGDADEKAPCSGWSAPVPLTAGELDELGIVGDLPGNITNYPVTPPTVVTCSGGGGCVSQLYFPDASALSAAIAACQAGELPSDICQYLGIG